MSTSFVVSDAADILSALEVSRHAELERIIEAGLATFIDVGKALLEIRDSRLYRENYSTFGDYCRERWGMSRIHAHRLIEAAGIATNLLPTGNISIHERQVRPLTKLESEQQQKAWRLATEISSNPTAEQVERAVDAIQAQDAATNSDKSLSGTPVEGNCSSQPDGNEEPNGEERQPEIPIGNLKRLVGELWTAALRNVPPKQEIEVAKLFLKMLQGKFPGLKG
jgi:hypothetical protein